MKENRSITVFLLWAAISVVLGAVVTAGMLTNTTLRTVERNLPNILLAQLYDLELIHDQLADAVAAAEMVRAVPGTENFARLSDKLREVETEVISLRETYVIDNLVQASAFHAIVAPAVADARQWLAEGISGYAPRSEETLSIVSGRIGAAQKSARAQQRASQMAARSILADQADRLNRFMFSVNLLFVMTFVIALIMVALLVRQNVLQGRERKAREEQRRAEEALRLSEQRFRQLAELLPQTVFEMDCNGRLIFVNNFAIRSFGYTIDDFDRGVLLTDLFAPQERETVRAELTRRLDLAGDSLGERFTAMHKDGHLFPVLIFTSKVRQDDEIIGLRGIITDISEQVRLQDERDRLEEQYSQAQKMEAVGRLAGGLAHDLNNLLVPIIGYGEILLSEIDLDDPHRRSVETVHQAGIKARDLVRQLLAFSRKQALEVKPVDLNRVVFEFQSLLRRTIREDIEIRLGLTEELPPIRADVGQIEQVLLNLAVNAQDAMPEGGRLIFETAMADFDFAHSPANIVETQRNWVMLTVRDTGCGIDADLQSRIFEPFFSTKDKRSGLGLAMVFGTVRQHGGVVQVESRPGEGAVFRCFFPASAEELPLPAEAPEPLGDPRKTGTVLVVEDNDEVRQLVVAILEKNGYRVISASGGVDCLGRLATCSGPIDLMLTDVVMPDTNGKALFDQVSQMFPGLRVLYMSGYTDNAIVHHGVLDEGVDFIQKPFSVVALQTKVREVLGR